MYICICIYIICIYAYVYISMYIHMYMSRYEHDIQVFAQDRGEAKVVGDDLDIIQVNRDITCF